MAFVTYKQPDEMDCGPTCLRMIAKHYGRSISLQKLRTISETTREGSTLKNIAEADENIGVIKFKMIKSEKVTYLINFLVLRYPYHYQLY